MTHRIIYFLLTAVLLSGILSIDAVTPSRWRAKHAAADTIPADTIPADTIPADTIPADTIPADTIPADTIPADTIPADTIPADTIPADTIPADTIPADTIPADTIPADTIPADTIPADTIPLNVEPKYYGDLNCDDVLDVADVNLMTNAILDDRWLPDNLFPVADIVADSVIDVSDLNCQIQSMLAGVLIPLPGTVPPDTVPPDTVPDDTVPPWDWLLMPPNRAICKMMIAIDRNRYDYGNGRMLVWNVTPGDSLRLTIDHDNNINVSMHSYVFYPDSDSTTWVAANALAAGPNIRTIAGCDTLALRVPDGAAVMVCSGFWFENGRIGDNGTAASNPFTAYRLERWTDTTGMEHLAKPRLRVLAVGNSFTCDELSYVPYVLQSLAPDVDVHLRLLTRASGSIDDWSDNPDSTSLRGGNNVFYDWQPFPGRWSLPMAGSLREMLAADDWELVTVQQVSTQPYWDSVQRPLHTITTWLRDTLDYQGRIGWVLSHAYSDSNVIMSAAFPELSTSDEMWHLTQQLADSVMHSGCVDLLLPCGTAVQNARHSALARFTRNQLCAGEWSSGNIGNIHLQEGIGPFVAACAAAGAIMGQPPEGASVTLSSTWRIPNANPTYSQSNTNPTLQVIEEHLGGLGMDADSQALGTWCASQALQHPFQLIDSEPENEDNTIASE